MSAIIPLDDEARLELIRLAGINDAVCRLYGLWLNRLHVPYLNSINHDSKSGAPSPWVAQGLMSLERGSRSDQPSRRFDRHDALYLYTGKSSHADMPPVLIALRDGLLRLNESSGITQEIGIIHAVRAYLFAACDERRSELLQVVSDHTPSTLQYACGRLVSLLKEADPRIAEEILKLFDARANQPSESVPVRDPLSRMCMRELDKIIPLL